MESVTPRDKRPMRIPPKPIECIYCGFVYLPQYMTVDYGNGKGICRWDYDEDEEDN